MRSMHKRLIAAAAGLLAFSSLALAQSTAPVVLPGGCGTASEAVNNSGYPTVDTSGRTCSSSVASAGGVSQGVTAAGNGARVAQDPTQLMWDDLRGGGGSPGTGVLDTAFNWKT